MPDRMWVFCLSSARAPLGPFCARLFSITSWFVQLFCSTASKREAIPIVPGRCLTSAASLLFSKSTYFSASSVVASCNKTTAVHRPFGRGQAHLSK